MRNDARIGQLLEELQNLRLRETAIVEELERFTGPTDTDLRSTPTGNPHIEDLRPGDRIWVTNRIRRPVSASSRWTATNERHATVTRVDVAASKVYFRTDNGTETWRSIQNLSFLAR